MDASHHFAMKTRRLYNKIVKSDYGRECDQGMKNYIKSLRMQYFAIARAIKSFLLSCLSHLDSQSSFLLRYSGSRRI